MPKKIQTFYLRTYGCQMNELDSEIMHGMLEQRGYVRVQNEKEADLIIYNTCSVRDLAERKVLGTLGKLLKTKKAHQIVGITGCMASAKKEALFNKIDGLDFVLGTNNIHDLNAILDEVCAGKQPAKAIRTEKKFQHELPYDLAKRTDPYRATVSIIRGCNKHCTYCIVPYTRGPEVSRHPHEILDECRRLIDAGYKEITLLGQNVNSYGKDHPEWNMGFHDLLGQIDTVCSTQRIRFLTSHPVDISLELMHAIRDLPSLCEFVHFPLQSGSNRILKKMNRGYTVEEYLQKVHTLRSLVPNVAIGTDIIVGFPTETEEDFQATCTAFKEIGFATAFLFAYSPRKGTPATRWVDGVPTHDKKTRLHQILALYNTVYEASLREFINKDVEVLVEEQNQKDPTLLRGRTRGWHNCVFPGSTALIGTLQRIRIRSLSNQTLIGEFSPIGGRQID